MRESWYNTKDELEIEFYTILHDLGEEIRTFYGSIFYGCFYLQILGKVNIIPPFKAVLVIFLLHIYFKNLKLFILLFFSYEIHSLTL